MPAALSFTEGIQNLACVQITTKVSDDVDDLRVIGQGQIY